jgi:UPF0755 protein
MKLKYILWSVGILLVFIATLIAIFTVGYRNLHAPILLSTAQLIEVPKGSSFNALVQQLTQRGLLENPVFFKSWARVTGKENRIQAGEYELSNGSSLLSFLEQMVRGEVKQYQLTLVEGWTFRQALDAIWSSERIVPSLRDKLPMEIARELELRQDSPEGWLFPDTFFYSGQTTDLEILRRSHQRMRDILANAWENRLGALPYESSYEALVMASMIEKESALGSERGHIAGVFVRRLEIGMRLQSDPTVIYGLGDSFTGDLRREDLRFDSPYNTYRVGGLPPTPIALPGLESIEASLNPLATEYLYFVAKGDGSHHFSSTLEEHNAAVRRYQLGQTD